MLVILASVAAIAAALGLLFSWLMGRDAASPRGLRALASAGWRPALAFTALVAVLFFLLTLPASPPFQEGMRLGWGFLIGAALGLLVFLDGAGSAAGAARAVRPLSAAALGGSGVLLLFPGDPTDALAGCALGAAFAAASLGSFIRPTLAGAAAPPAVLGVEIYALAAAAASAGAWLGIVRFPRPVPDALAAGYWAVPPLFLATGALALMLLAAGGRVARSRALASGLAAAVIAVGVLAVLQWRLLPGLRWPAALFGPLAAAFVVFAFLREEPDPETTGHGLAPRPTLLAVGASLLAVVAAAVAFRQMQGFGQALTAGGAALVVAATAMAAGPAAAGEAAPGRSALRLDPRFAEAFGMGAATLMALLAWMRVFLERAERLRTLDFQQPYNLIAAALGVAAVFSVMAITDRAARRGAAVTWAHAGGTVLLGFLAAATPLLIAALWAERAVAALLMGLVLGEAVWIMLLAWTRAERAETLAAAPHVVLLSVALIAAQLTPVVFAMELTRANKVTLVVAAAILAVVGIVWEAVGGSPARVPEVREARDEPIQ